MKMLKHLLDYHDIELVTALREVLAADVAALRTAILRRADIQLEAANVPGSCVLAYPIKQAAFAATDFRHGQ